MRGLVAQVVPKDAKGELAQVQGLAVQLEAARSTIMKLQQYEMMYKESRMRTKQMGAELATLQVRPAGAGMCC